MISRGFLRRPAFALWEYFCFSPRRNLQRHPRPRPFSPRISLCASCGVAAGRLPCALFLIRCCVPPGGSRRGVASRSARLLSPADVTAIFCLQQLTQSANQTQNRSCTVLCVPKTRSNKRRKWSTHFGYEASRNANMRLSLSTMQFSGTRSGGPVGGVGVDAAGAARSSSGGERPA